MFDGLRYQPFSEELAIISLYSECWPFIGLVLYIHMFRTKKQLMEAVPRESSI